MAQSLLFNEEQVRAEINSIYETADEVSAKAKKLSEVVDECINRGIRTKWAYALKNKLDDFTNVTMKDSIKLMKQQASQIGLAAAEVVEYSETIK